MKLLTIADLAVRLSAHPETVRKWTRSGLIPGAMKIPGGDEAQGVVWRFRAEDVEAWLEGRA